MYFSLRRKILKSRTTARHSVTIVFTCVLLKILQRGGIIETMLLNAELVRRKPLV